MAHKSKRISDWPSCGIAARPRPAAGSPLIRHAREKVGLGLLLAPVLATIETVEKHCGRILRRWASLHSNARMEAFNGIFQAARARARGYRNVRTFITMIYLIAAPLGDILKST